MNPNVTEIETGVLERCLAAAHAKNWTGIVVARQFPGGPYIARTVDSDGNVAGPASWEPHAEPENAIRDLHRQLS